MQQAAMRDSIDNRAKDILRALGNAMKLKPDALCLCGSGRLLADCCSNKSDKEIVFTKRSFAAALRYRDSQGGRVTSIPQGVFRQFQEASLQRLPCLYPGCSREPVSCHLIPENVLRSCFGGHCLGAKLRDSSPQEVFFRMGVGQAGVLPVFCAEHDNDLFYSVDHLPGDLFKSPECLFLLSFKAIAFALRKVQILLGIDLQVELFKPFLIQDKIKGASLTHVEIDISYLQTQYTRFELTERLFARAITALQASKRDCFSYYTRSVPCNDSVFFAGLVNPSHDLEGQRVNTKWVPISIVCNVLAVGNELLVLLSSPDDGSSQAYANLFQQLHWADNQTVAGVVNNIMTFAADKPLLATNRLISPDDLRRIAYQRERAARCLNTASKEVFKLHDPENSVRFIVI